MIETVDDIVEELADKLYIYEGGCTALSSEHGKCVQQDIYRSCRVCFVSDMRQRIMDASETERKLNL